MAAQACPRCNSNNVRRSRTRGLKERWLKKLGYRAYRCNESECQWRGLLKTKSIRGELNELIGTHKKSLIISLVALGLIGLAAGVFYYYALFAT